MRNVIFNSIKLCMIILFFSAVMLGCDVTSGIPEYRLSGSWESIDKDDRFTEAESEVSSAEADMSVSRASLVSPRTAASDAPYAVIVRYHEGIEKTRETASGIGLYGREIPRAERSGFNFSRVEIDRTRTNSLEEIIRYYESLPGVKYAEEDHRVSSQTTVTVNDEYYHKQWNFIQLEMTAAWGITEGKSSVTVAIIDTGIAEGISDFAGTNFVGGWNYVSDNDDTLDDNGHGTHVSGTVAQTTHNAHGTAGMAYGVTLMPIKILDGSGEGFSSDLAAGIIWASDHGADIINLSLAGGEFNQTTYDAIEYAYKQKGVTIFAASGNNGTDNVSFPAAYEYVIAVGATTNTKNRASYSNYGKKLDIVAPGGDTSILQKNGILQQTVIDEVEDFYYLQGTSMAAPHAAALGALLLSRNPQLSPAEIYAAITQTAEDLGTAGKDDYYGYGLINPAAALEFITDIQTYHVSDSVYAVYDDAEQLHDQWHFQAEKGEIRLSLSGTGNDIAMTLYDHAGAALVSTSGYVEHEISYQVGNNGGEFFVRVHWNDL